VQQPYPPLYVGGGPASFKRIARLQAGWISASRSADVLPDQLAELRMVASHDAPIIHLHMGEHTASEIEKYYQLGLEHVLVELATAPRDQTLCALDALQAEFAELTQSRV